MNWKVLENSNQIEEIKEASHNKLQLIFKHSTRCIISKMALKNFENDFLLHDVIDAYYLDLIDYRSISNEIADDFRITHQSPQILLIKDGKVVYNESHESIDANVLKEFV
ncbi:bacillithiol system redox-active protein YtxJ [Paenimyroides baculatum]|uniref:Bacillithiol system redox-active protein YtxJ n=2 Tax=Paenimyroides baculatum TaxID=2608000 RepID=A0A5M6CLB0_9FLAO|nr:bacillithiol system redox-active protein YtxJ [Paenimyroides baculatum]KAA5535816.1 bacillithiol system redox-active protein YtxJ [Paenimyroides baculatum]